MGEVSVDLVRHLVADDRDAFAVVERVPERQADDELPAAKNADLAVSRVESKLERDDVDRPGAEVCRDSVDQSIECRRRLAGHHHGARPN